jgi:acetyl esterase
MRINKWLIISVLLIASLLGTGIILVNTWSQTPYGKLDPKVAIFLKLLSGPGQNSFKTDRPIAENRAELEKIAALVSGSPVSLALVKDINIPGSTSDIPARIYAPDDRRHPIIIYFHGGGWVQGSINSHDSVCRTLARKARALVISVGYGLAPEHAFPAAVNDAYDALMYIYQNAEGLKGDPAHIAVAGDSAGGTLAAVVAQMSRDRHGPAIAYQALIYPVTNLADMNTASYRNFSEGYLLTRSDMQAFISLYTPDKKDRLNPYASPMLASNFSNLPPALVITAQFDVLRDEGEAYANALERAGVHVRTRRYGGVIHGFMTGDRFLSQADDATSAIADTLREAFR